MRCAVGPLLRCAVSPYQLDRVARRALPLAFSGFLLLLAWREQRSFGAGTHFFLWFCVSYAALNAAVLVLDLSSAQPDRDGAGGGGAGAPRLL